MRRAARLVKIALKNRVADACRFGQNKKRYPKNGDTGCIVGMVKAVLYQGAYGAIIMLVEVVMMVLGNRE